MKKNDSKFSRSVEGTTGETKYTDQIATAIVLTAAKDYKKALADGDKFNAHSCENFFMSNWFEMLSNMDGMYLVNSIRKELGFRAIEKRKVCF